MTGVPVSSTRGNFSRGTGTPGTPRHPPDETPGQTPSEREPLDDLDAHGDPIDVRDAIRIFLEQMSPAWMRQAACRSRVDLDFVSTSPAVISKCIAVCGTCPVREECREFADETGDVQAVLGGEDAAARRARWRVRGRGGVDAAP